MFTYHCKLKQLKLCSYLINVYFYIDIVIYLFTLITNVFPQQVATGNIHKGIIAGKLNGAIPAQTPRGSR